MTKGKTKTVAKSSVSKAEATRQRKLNRKQRKQKAKKEAASKPAIPNSFKLTKHAVKLIISNWKVLGGIVLVYIVLNVIFASGISNLGNAVNGIKDNIDASSTSSLSPLSTALNGFGSLVASAGTSGSSTGSVLQTVLIVLESLVIIWALRQLSAGVKIGVKQAYYSSTFPLIPFLLVITVIFIQLLPLLLGSPVVSTILASAFVGGGVLPTIIFAAFFVSFALWSFYMVSSSIFALYIVTLPDMHPRRALRSAKHLVEHRRWSIMRKLFFLPIVIFFGMALVVVPLIMFATVLVAPIFFVLSMFSLLFAHAYVYGLYRNLLE